MVVRSYAELHRMLEGERSRLKQNLEHSNGESWADERIGYGNHMADNATEAFEQAKGVSVRNRLEDTLHDVEHALHKFEEGTYGVCENCGQRIDWARLEAKPEARLCIQCQQRKDFGR